MERDPAGLTEPPEKSWVAAFLLGGLVAAPIAAWLVRLLPPRVLGSAVGGVIVVTNARTLLPNAMLYVALYGLWAAALAYSVRVHLRERRAAGTELVDERQPVGT
ncbi:hypothetical protein ACIP4S_03590 [Streptomyces chartreusis]|uniref:hypothetical protein n=1 Tax=Streptomyces chartreusis TaxID=1969 RepID=UPI00380A431E